MLSTQSRRRLAIVASGALAAGALAVTAPTAQGAPVFVDTETNLDPFAYGNSYVYVGSPDCTYSSSGSAEPDVPVVENGPVVTASASGSATFANTSIPSDTATGSATASGTAKVTSSGGNLSTIDLAVSASSQLTNAVGTSAECVRTVDAGVQLEFEFTVTQPGLLTLTTKGTGTGAYGSVDIERYDPVNPSDSQPYLEQDGYGTHLNSTTRMYLPAGIYGGSFSGESYTYSRSSYARSGTTTIHAEFHVAGSQTEAVAGKGKKYVALPAARSCAAHSLAPSVTGKKKRAEQIKQVTFFVNGTKVKRVKTPDKGDVVTLPVADDQTSEVTAEVQLLPAKKGKPGRVLTVGASYEACS